MTLEERHDFELLKTQCLALPQADRDALIEALQKPVRDWADDVWAKMMAAGNRAADNEEGAQFHESGQVYDVAVEDAEKSVIRSMCRPKAKKQS